MQQTETYKLNLIEPSDPFLPDGLNQNTRKIEDAMLAHEAAVAEAVAKISDRIAVFEAKKFVYGGFSDSTGSVEVNLGFRPKLVIVFNAYRDGTANFCADNLENSDYTLGIEDWGFHVNLGLAYGHHPYIAIA